MPTKTSVYLRQRDLRNVLSKLEPKKYEEVLDLGLKVLGGLAETRIGLEAVKTVYSYVPKKPNAYVRTGRLLGGRGGLSNPTPAKTQIGPDKIKIEANPKLKGAKTNYAPIVNDGYDGTFKVKAHTRGGVSIRAHTRTAKMKARPFWDNSIGWIESTGLRRTKEEMEKMIKKIIK